MEVLAARRWRSTVSEVDDGELTIADKRRLTDYWQRSLRHSDETSSRHKR